jgi:acetyl esterase/lipase
MEPFNNLQGDSPPLKRTSQRVQCTMASKSIILLWCASCAAVFAQATRPPDLWKRPAPAGERKLAYGKDPLQFGELLVPEANGPHPVVILIHGGCWVDRLPNRDPRDTSFEPLRPLAAALAEAGVATWNLEYRRAGSPGGGGWPATFLDLAAGVDFLRSIARAKHLDLSRVVVVGHSAGGHFAHWLAARQKLSPSSPLYIERPLQLKAVVNVDGPPDLASAQPLERKFCPVPGVTELMGGSPAEMPERYRDASATPFLPTGVPQTVFAGGLLLPRYDLVTGYESTAKAKGDSVTVVKLEGSGHFDMLAPEGPFGKTLIESILALTK